MHSAFSAGHKGKRPSSLGTVELTFEAYAVSLLDVARLLDLSFPISEYKFDKR